MEKMTHWIKAIRLRTLPLSLATIALGSMLAASYGFHKWALTTGAILTTIFLQVLSNLANDYGDSQNGADHHKRKGPERMVQTGMISMKEMYMAIVLFVILSFLAGTWLCVEAFGWNSVRFWVFFGMLILCIYAAIKYTAGKNPYGYKALGDISVFIFFGIFGVAASFYLHSSELFWLVLIPAMSVGFLCMGVLNLNNMRDIPSDTQAGKVTIPILLGLNKAKVYHTLLISLALILPVFFVFNREGEINLYDFLFTLVAPILLKHLITIWKIQDHMEFDPLLKKLAITTLLFCILLGLGQIL